MNGDAPSVISGVTLSTTTGAAATAGTHAITATGGTAANYTITDVNGTLTVTKAPLTIIANSQTIVAGQSLPALTVSYSGFVNGDTSASFTTPPTLSTTASPASPAGTYPITVSGASSPNYTITSVAGTLTVNPALATVTSVKVEKLKKGKKTTQVIVVQFSEALNTGAAQNVHNYSLVTVPKSKKQKGKAVSLASASYSASALTVTLTTRKALVLNPPLNLTISAAGLLDALGRPLGATYAATLKKVGAPVTPTVPLVRARALSADVVDAVLGAGFRTAFRQSRP